MSAEARADRLLTALIGAFVASDGADAPLVSQTAAPGRLREMIGRLPRRERFLFQVGMTTLQGLSWLRFQRPFSRLGPVPARRLLRSLEGSALKPLRRLHYGLKMLCQFAYFADERAWPVCDYGGPWLGRVDVEVAGPPDLGEQV